jgi:hypothetical protein
MIGTARSGPERLASAFSTIAIHRQRFRRVSLLFQLHWRRSTERLPIASYADQRSTRFDSHLQPSPIAVPAWRISTPVRPRPDHVCGTDRHYLEPHRR